MNLSTESLAECYLMMGKFSDQDDFQHKLINSLSEGKKLVQFRQKNIENSNYLALTRIAGAVCKQFDSLLFLGTSVDVFNQASADGLHLNSQILFEYDERPIASHYLLSISCHNSAEMKQAEKLGADILLLSPVKATASHPELEALGWQQFTQMIEAVQCPVYALGGMQPTDLMDAKQAGAQGIAFSSS